MYIKYDKHTMIKDLILMSKCVSSLVCVRQCKECVCVLTKLLHWSLEWRPEKGKLDAATARCVPGFSTFHRPGNRTQRGHMWNMYIFANK